MFGKRKRAGMVLFMAAAGIFISSGLFGCGSDSAEERTGGQNPGNEAAESVREKAEEPPMLNFVDAHGEHYQVEISDRIEKHTYDWDNLKKENGLVSYEDDHYISRLGIDVSHHQGQIDWEKVKNAGVSFAFVRIGYRGYGEDGKLCPDETALENIKNAKAAGIDVGCYFFSQAVNEEEAQEEADFVLAQLDGMKLELPVVYDPETIQNDEARTDDVSGEQFSKNTVKFCSAVRDAGYDVMIYSNMVWEAFQFDPGLLDQSDIWYADYEENPQTPYHFSIWQYTEKGRIDGVEGDVDLNIEFMEKE